MKLTLDQYPNIAVIIDSLRNLNWDSFILRIDDHTGAKEISRCYGVADIHGKHTTVYTVDNIHANLLGFLGRDDKREIHRHEISYMQYAEGKYFVAHSWE